MDWFYDKQITFGKSISEYDASTGLYSDDTTGIITVACDVQPLNTKTDLDETGKLIDANYKVFCDSSDFITADCAVTYRDTDYSIVKVIDWDDYFIVYIKAVK